MRGICAPEREFRIKFLSASYDAGDFQERRTCRS